MINNYKIIILMPYFFICLHIDDILLHLSVMLFLNALDDKFNNNNSIILYNVYDGFLYKYIWNDI